MASAWLGNDMEIRSVAVIGAGTMGAGIAQVCAQAGWQTRLFDAFPEGLEAGMARIDSFWDKGIARGKTTSEQKAEW
ncbi:MAG TPA: 3-hydroxybutyryl-CoA dehydrogenase, partial [Candidatus Poseidoniales archaeon]|nr:3-hydroxybutyryl-CoA dehydrogenase [Candidatus Poseidoniales archaeon]